MLGRIRKRAGRVRDLDVQLAALRSLKVPWNRAAKPNSCNSLIELRAEHERKLAEGTDKQTWFAIYGSGWCEPQESGLRNRAGIRWTVAQRNAGTGRYARPARSTEDLLHQYRIAGKRARYAAEFAPKSAEADGSSRNSSALRTRWATGTTGSP